MFLRFLFYTILLSNILFSSSQIIKVSYDPDYAPFSYIISDKPQGLLIDIWKEWAKTNNYSIEFINGESWDNAITLAKENKVDFFLGTLPYEDWMKGSIPLYGTTTAIFTLKDNAMDFSSIGIIGEDYKEVLHEKFKNITITSFETYNELIDALLNKEVSAIYDDSIAINNYLIQNLLNHAVIQTKIFSSSAQINAISYKQSMIDIFNKGFKNIEFTKLQKIEKNWIHNIEYRYFVANKELDFSQEEKQWLEKTPILRIAIMDYWESDNNGNNIHTEVIRLLNKYGEINIVPIKYQSWKEGFGDASEGINVHGIMGLSYSKEREEKYFSYSTAYNFTPFYLITKKSDNTIKKINQISNKTIYIKSNSILKKMIKNKFPNAKIIEKETIEKLYQTYADSNDLDVLLTYYKKDKLIKKYNLQTVETLYDRYGEVAIGTHHKHKELASIIKKALKKIPSTELTKIREKTYKKTSKLQLTEKELKWIENNPVITVHNEKNWAPINFNKDGIPTGMSIDFMNLLAKKTNLEIKYVTGEWNNLYNQALNKKLDVMLNIAKSKEREKFFLFTSSYQNNAIAIYGKPSDHNIKSIESLNGKKVTIVDGFYHENMIRNQFPLIQVIPVKNAKEALKLVCENKADATIGSFIVYNHLIQETLCQNIEYKIPFTVEEDVGLHIAVRNDYPELHSILQKAMADVGSNELNQIRKKWISTIETKKTLELTAKEKLWIKNNPFINVAGETDWAPIDFVNENGKYTGLAKDYLDFITNQTGIQFNIHTGLTWNEIIKEFKNGSFDLLPALNLTEERKKFALFTKPYFALTKYYITKKDYPKIKNIKELYGKNVASIEGYDITSWLEKNHPEINIIKVNSILEAIRAIESEDAVTFINDDASTSHIMRQNFISNLIFNNIVKIKPPSPIHMAVQKEHIVLQSILNKVFSLMSQTEKEKIASKWIQSIDKNRKVLNLSKSEIQWLQTQPVIQFAVDPNWLPIEAIDTTKNNLYTGMMGDYLKKIQEISGLEFQLVPTTKWSESVALAKENKVDMLAAISKTPERENYLNFSNNTFNLTDGVIMNHSAKFISKLDELKGLKVGISAGTSLHKMIKEKYPMLNLVTIKGTENGINQLSKGEIDAYVGNLEVISYLIFKKNLLNLKVALKLDTSRKLYIALHKNYPKEALSIINKAIDSIDDEDLNLIKKRWIGLKVHNDIDYMLLIKIALGVLVVIAFFIYNNRKLHKMVNERTKEISKQKDELENLSKNLEKIVDQRTQQLHDERNYINSIMNSQENILVSTNGDKIHTANRAFFFFFQMQSLEEFFSTYGNCICDTFDNDDDSFIQKTVGDQSWINYIYNNNEKLNKVKITLNEKTHIFSVTADQFFHDNKKLDVAVFTDITKLEEIQKELKQIHKNTQDSIEYASLIQHALIPEQEPFSKYFDDFFTIWKPKDIVGGDIYLFEHLRNDNECLLMVIDCTGHGVPGAFVTMLVKAIERQLISKYINNEELEVSTAWILSYFNKSMKKLLKQEDSQSISNAGFDGGILYYNKLDGTIKYSGAETPLFYFDENSNLQMIKGDRHSIGYKKSDINYQFKEHTVKIQKGMRFYLTTDGYLDQNGGLKGFPFGKKQFQKILQENQLEPFNDQKEILLDSLQEYQKNNETNDDITVIGLKI